MRKIGIKLQDRAGRSEAGRCSRGSSAHTRVGDRAGRSPMAAAPPRQLPFRWKCDGCPLFRMIKYRRKNGVPGAETRALVFFNHANRKLALLSSFSSLSTNRPSILLPSPLFESVINRLRGEKKLDGRAKLEAVLLMQYLFIPLSWSNDAEY